MHNAFPDFIQVDKTDFKNCHFARIVLDGDNYQVRTKNLTVLAQWETGNKSGIQTNMFQRDDELVFQIVVLP